jgi:GT2 family glycosyltransferase
MQANIESIRKYAGAGNYKIVVVDNASTDGVEEWLSQQEDILFISNQKNVGYGPACNQGVEATIGTEFEDSDVLILNNDTRLTPGALSKLKEALYSTADTGAVGCVANRAGNKQQIDVVFDNVEDYISYGEKNNVEMPDPTLERVRLSGFALLVRRSVWDEVGGFDEDFVPGYFEDDALSMEILKRGYRLRVVRNSFIYHIGTESFKNVDIDSYVYKNYQLFMKKYGFDIIPYSDASGAVISHIPYKPEDKFFVLHFGCGLGADIKAVKSIFPNSTAAGIEENGHLRNIVSATEKVYKSLGDYISEKGEQKIDVLIISKAELEKMSDEDKDIIVKHFTDKTALLYKEYSNE